MEAKGGFAETGFSVARSAQMHLLLLCFGLSANPCIPLSFMCLLASLGNRTRVRCVAQDAIVPIVTARLYACRNGVDSPLAAQVRYGGV